jgi:hypothetical protein
MDVKLLAPHFTSLPSEHRGRVLTHHSFVPFVYCYLLPLLCNTDNHNAISFSSLLYFVCVSTSIDILLMDYIEELSAQIVGANRTYAFFKYCFTGQTYQVGTISLPIPPYNIIASI